MYLTGLEAEHFRNLAHIRLEPDPRYNLIVGQNAQGKTNLLEAIWLLTGCRSFRGARERDLIGFDQEVMRMQAAFRDSRRDQQITYALQRSSREKKITLNGVPLRGGSRLFQQFQCVVFTPDDTMLIKGLPDRRRNFLDLCCAQIRPKNMEVLRRFDNLTVQRNLVLRSIAAGKGTPLDLAIWDAQLAMVGAQLSIVRHQYVQRLAPVCARLYGIITGGREQLSVEYQSGMYREYEMPDRVDEPMRDYYLRKLTMSSTDDIRVGYTTIGAGRDDLLFKINGKPVRDFGSQGQKKSTALVLKLAQAEIFRTSQGQSPVILLDDVMGELDKSRQQLVYSIVQDMQVFISTCNESAVLDSDRGMRITIENGKIV